MDKLNFVFLIRDDRSWEQLFSHVINLKKQSVTDKIAVVSVGTALLSCLKSTHLDKFKSTIMHFKDEGMEFYQCFIVELFACVDLHLAMPPRRVGRMKNIRRGAVL